MSTAGSGQWRVDGEVWKVEVEDGRPDGRWRMEVDSGVEGGE
jgi:hypothetical protein